MQGVLTKTAIVLGLLAVAPALAQAETWQPTRSIKMICPFPAGGGTDLIARLAAKGLSERLGQQVYVENRGGANGAIGVQQLMQADPDGYTIGAISDGPMIVNPALYPNNPYQPLRDFIGVGQLIKFPSMLVANAGTGIKTVADMIKAAKEWVKANPKAKAPWDADGFRLPGGQIYSKGGMMTWPAANAIYRRETYDNYPAARAILQAAYEGLLLPMDRALTVESRYFTKILRSPEAAAMIRSLFVSMQELNKGARRPASVPPTQIKKVGIIGAGFMGAGIASVSAQSGIDVILIDRDQESADKGKALIQKSLTDQVNKGRATAAQRDAVLGKITATADYGALKGVDLVIEAVFEDRKVKADATVKAQAVVPDVVFGSNTSTLPITSLAETAKDPAKFIGVHFFSPVERMMLVEVIVGKKTGDAALATALDFVRALRKTPIVVNDTRGFYANRCVLNYIQEGHLMLLEGIPAAMIENTARMAGMPVGPLSLNDETAIDLGLKIVRAAEADLGPQAINPAQKKLLEDMVEKNGRLGRKNGKGFYDYTPGKPKRLWPELEALLPKKLSRDEIEKLDVEEMKQRFLVTQAVEAARTFEENVVTDVREADVGSILGFGFAPFSGGTLSYIDMMGTKNFVMLCERLAKKYGPRFEPPKLLRDMAAKGESFYTRFAPGKKAA